MATGPGSWDFVDEVEALLPEAGQGLGEVWDAIRDMVQSLAPFLQEASNGCIRIQGLQELDGSDEADPNTLARKLLHRGASFAAEAFEEEGGLLQ
jgi:hypothetical protein